MDSAAHDSIFFNGTLVHVVQYSLKYPEAHAFLDDFKSSLSLVYHPETQLHAVILDFTAVEYLDYTGVQTLLAAKDFLAEVGGHRDEIPLHFANMRTSHLNRLMRVANHNLPAEPDASASDAATAAALAAAALAVAAVPAPRMGSSSPSPTVMTDSDIVPSRSRRPSMKQGGLMASLSAIGRTLSIGASANGSSGIKKSKSSGSISAAVDEAPSSADNTLPKTASGVFDQEMPMANVRALKYFHSSLDEALRAVVA